MSEHVQPAPGPHAPPAATAEMHARTPGVASENRWFNFRLVLGVGIGLAVIIAAIQVGVWWLLRDLQNNNARPAGALSELALEEAAKPLGQRIDKVPTPHLEGIERESSLIVLRTENGEEARFYGSPDLHVQIDKKKDAKLFELREGQRVTLTYYLPSGVDGALGVVTAVNSPSVESDQKKPEPELPDTTRKVNGVILRIEAHSIAAAREWAEVQMERYGWIDRDKDIVHIPIDRAMEEVLKSKEFRPAKNQKKSDGRLGLPSRSSSGRERTGGKR